MQNDKMRGNILKAIFDVLEDENTEVYFSEKHQGECTKRYNVIKMGGSDVDPLVSSERPTYIIMCYVPYLQYTTLDDFVRETKQKLKKLYPRIKYDGMETPSYYDKEVKAYRVSFQYIGIKKIEYF